MKDVPLDNVSHTPGPWHGEVMRDIPTIVGANGDLVCQFSFINGNELGNVRLITAAPALLAACDAAYRILGDIHHHWKGRDSIEGQGLLCALRDAISEATGREGEEVQDYYAVRR